MTKLILIVFIVSFSLSPAFSQRLKWKDIDLFEGYSISSIAYNNFNYKFYALATPEFHSHGVGQYLMKSEDSCRTWTPIRKQYGYNIKCDKQGNIYELFSWFDDTLSISKDEGETFNPIYFGNWEDFRYDCNYIIGDDSTIFVFSKTNNIYDYSTDFGITWQRTDKEIEKLVVGNILNQSYLITKADMKLAKVNDYPYTRYYNISSKNKILKLNRNGRTEEVFSTDYRFGSRAIVLSFTKLDDRYYILIGDEFFNSLDGAYYTFFQILIADSNFNVISVTPIKGLYPYQDYPFNIFVNNNSEIIIQAQNDIGYLDSSFNFNYISYDDELRKETNSIFISNSCYISSDGCRTWKNAIQDDIKVTAKSIKNILFPDSSNIVVVDTNNRIFTTDDFFWHLSNITPKLLPMQNITCLKKTKNNNLVVGTESEGILVRKDDSTWEKRNKGLASLKINDLIQTRTGDFYICTSKGLYYTNDDFKTNSFMYSADIKKVVEFDNSLYVVTNDGKFISLTFNNGVIVDVHTHLNGKFISSVAANDSVVIAGSLDSGFYRTRNNGISWQEANLGFYYQDIYQIISTKDNEFIAISNKGAFFSNNNADYWENLPDFNSTDRLTIIDNKIFRNKDFSKYIEAISKDSMYAPVGWIDKVSYLTHNFNLSYAKLSGDYNYMYNGGNGYFEVYDFKTGVKQKFYSEFAINGNRNHSDYDTSGNLLYYVEKYVNNRRIYSIICGNEKSGKQLFDISLLDSNHFYNMYINTKFSKENDEIHAVINVVDSTKDSSNERAFSVYFRMVKNGKIIESRKLPSMYIKNWSKNCKKTLFNPHVNYKSGGGFGVDRLFEREYYIYDNEKNITTSIDTTGIAYYHEFSYFSEDGKYLFLTIEDDHYRFINLLFSLESDTSGKPLKYFRKLKFTPIQILQLDSDNYLCIVGGSYYKFIIYNIKEDKITKYSRYPGLIVNNGGINRIPGTNEVMVNNKRYNLDKIMVDYDFPKIDFTANKARVNSCRDTLIFEASYYSPDIEYKWDFGDGKIDYGIIVSHKYEAPGNYTVKLNYKDNMLGLSYSDSVVKVKYINVYADNFIHVNKNKVLTNEEVEIGVRVDTCYNCSPNTYYRYYFGDSTTKISMFSVKHSYAKPGIYDVSVVYSLSCKNKYIVDSIYSKALIIVEQGTDVEPDLDNQLLIFPNPASDYIEISLGAQRAVTDHVAVFDLLGMEVQEVDSRFRGNDNNEQGGEIIRIDVSHLAPGVYFVRAGDEVRKFIKM